MVLSTKQKNFLIVIILSLKVKRKSTNSMDPHQGPDDYWDLTKRINILERIKDSEYYDVDEQILLRYERGEWMKARGPKILDTGGEINDTWTVEKPTGSVPLTMGGTSGLIPDGHWGRTSQFYEDVVKYSKEWNVDMKVETKYTPIFKDPIY